MSDHVQDQRRLAEEYRFRVGNLKPDVQVKIWENLDEKAGYRYTSSQSHYIHAPDLIGPYMSSRTFDDSPEELFAEVVSGFEMFYKENGWLVANEDF